MDDVTLSEAEILQSSPSALFRSLVAILGLYVGQPTNRVTQTLVDLGEAEAVQCHKNVLTARTTRTAAPQLEKKKGR